MASDNIFGDYGDSVVLSMVGKGPLKLIETPEESGYKIPRNSYPVGDNWKTITGQRSQMMGRHLSQGYMSLNKK